MLFKEKIKPVVNVLQLPVLAQNKIEAAVLRLDSIHPQISGNKWYKLKEYLKEAQQQNKNTLLTFGGAFSNHILATASTCKMFGFASVGIIRGEEPKNLSSTLINAAQLGMHLFFVSREEYKEKKVPSVVLEKFPDVYLVEEGGYGHNGMQGAQSILKEVSGENYSHIIAAVGTGTTLAGLIEASQKQQQLIGISVLKNHFELRQHINALLSPANQNRFQLIHDYPFGGYAKHQPELIAFMNNWYVQTSIPSDFVYTGKLFYAFHDLCLKGFFKKNSKILIIHSGGLQGNCSLNKGTLLF